MPLAPTPLGTFSGTTASSHRASSGSTQFCVPMPISPECRTKGLYRVVAVSPHEFLLIGSGKFPQNLRPHAGHGVGAVVGERRVAGRVVVRIMRGGRMCGSSTLISVNVNSCC